ncbi:Uncharacterised protein [Klebsiella pneumoniae]|uniref:Uncharacterized protein n=1 Tax=Klebsiella pneumoniae TaxID=573 RepID=A0A4P0XZD6_KLEPN|nr:Uncharacterised protein [Klebsiella pneumoniae]
MWYFHGFWERFLPVLLGSLPRWRLSTWKPPKPGRKKKSDKFIATLYAIMDKRPLRALSLLMALLWLAAFFGIRRALRRRPASWKSGMVSC